MKRIIIDTETTGLDPAVCGIWELALIVEIDGKVRERYHAVMDPGDVQITQSALDVNGITPAWLRKQDPQDVVFKEVIELLDDYVDRYNRTDKMLMYAYNSMFDEAFVRRWFERNGHRYYGSYFYSNSVDVMSLAAHVLASLRSEVPDFKLGTISSIFGVNLSESHEAEADVSATYELLRVLEKEHLIVKL